MILAKKCNIKIKKKTMGSCKSKIRDVDHSVWNEKSKSTNIQPHVDYENMDIILYNTPIMSPQEKFDYTVEVLKNAGFY